MSKWKKRANVIRNTTGLYCLGFGISLLTSNKEGRKILLSIFEGIDLVESLSTLRVPRTYN